MKSNFGKRIVKALPYIIVTLVVYVALPLCAMAAKSVAVYNLVPIFDCCAAMAVGYFFGRRGGRDPVMPLFSALLFLPCMAIFYNLTAWIYMPVAALASFLGECVGALYQNKFGR